MPCADKEKEKSYQRQWRETHKEERKAYAAAWNQAHPYSSLSPQEKRVRYLTKVRMQQRDPEGRKAERRRHYERHAEARRAASRSTPPEVRKQRQLKHKYGLSLEAFQSLLDKQLGLCAICAEPMNPPHVDHDHATGKVRDLLCRRCNMALGAFKEDPAWLARAIAYLEGHRAA